MVDKIGLFLSTAQNYYLFFAIVGSIFFLYSLVSILIGGDIDDVMEDSTGGIDGLQFLSIKGVISFVTFFGWVGFFWGHTGFLGLVLALGCGVLMMGLTALVIFLLLKMQQSGNLKPEDFIGCSGVVYLTIPAGKLGGGQATVSLKNCTRKVPAVAIEELKQGTAIKVVENIGDNLYVVEKL